MSKTTKFKLIRVYPNYTHWQCGQCTDDFFIRRGIHPSQRFGKCPCCGLPIEHGTAEQR